LDAHRIATHIEREEPHVAVDSKRRPPSTATTSFRKYEGPVARAALRFCVLPAPCPFR